MSGNYKDSVVPNEALSGHICLALSTVNGVSTSISTSTRSAADSAWLTFRTSGIKTYRSRAGGFRLVLWNPPPVFLRSLYKHPVATSCLRSCCCGNQIKEAYTELNRYRPRTNPESDSRKNGVYSSAASRCRYSLMSSKNIVPEPPGVVILPWVPRPIAILSTSARFTP